MNPVHLPDRVISEKPERTVLSPATTGRVNLSNVLSNSIQLVPQSKGFSTRNSEYPAYQWRIFVMRSGKDLLCRIA